MSPDFNFLLTNSYLAKRAEKLAAMKMAERLQGGRSSYSKSEGPKSPPPTAEETAKNREKRITSTYYGRHGLYEYCVKGADGVAVVLMKAVAKGHANDANTTCDIFLADGRRDKVSVVSVPHHTSPHFTTPHCSTLHCSF